jgi:hypothetical protein
MSNQQQVRKQKVPTELSAKLLEARQEIERARVSGDEYVEVPEDVFKFMTQGAETPFLTDGNPGVMVFVEGTREKLMSQGNMPAEVYYDKYIKKALG